MTYDTLIALGPCTLYCGDCLEILPTLEGVDAVITDPPYGLGENANRVASRTKMAATTDYGDFEWDSEPASQERIQATVAAADSVVIWGGNYFHLAPSRGWLVWDKLNSGNFADCELAWTNLRMSVRIFRHRWNGMIRETENDVKRVHPTQKPVALMKWCLDWLPDDSNTVLDPFMGSGTTGLACLRTGRRFIGIEKDPNHFAAARRRIEAELAQPYIPQLAPTYEQTKFA